MASGQKKAYASPEREEANKLLAEIGYTQEDLSLSKGDLARELERLKETSPFWPILQDAVTQNEERLQSAIETLYALMKEHQADFFAVDGLGSCSLDLPHGVLLYAKEDYVVKPRKVDVLANLERYGFEEAIRRTAAVDWEALDNKDEWPDEVLAIIGTRREIKETYAYEVVSGQLPVASKD